MTLKELLNLVQTDPIEALKEAFEMGSKWAEGTGSSQECDYTEDQFMAFMDGAKSGMGLKSASIDTSKLTEMDIEKYLKLIEKWKLKPEPDPYKPTVVPYTFDPNKPWWQNGPTCSPTNITSSTSSVRDGLDRIQPKET